MGCSHTSNVSHTGAPDIYEYKLRGIISFLKGEYADAIESYSIALKNDPGNAELLLHRARLYSLTEQYDKAISDSTRALTINSELYEAYSLRIESRLKKILSDKTIFNTIFKYGPEKYPSDPREISLDKTSFNLALIYSDIENAFRINPASQELYLWRGIAHFLNEGYTQSAGDFTVTIKSNPDNSAAYFFRSAAFLKINHLKNAANDLNKAITLKTDIPLAYFNRAALNLDGGNYACSITDYTNLISEKFLLNECYLYRGICFDKVSECGKAIDDFSNNLLLTPPNWIALYYRAKNYYTVKKYPEAIEDYTKLLTICNNTDRLKELYYYRGLSYLNLKSYPEAINDLSCAKQNRFAPSIIHQHLGDIYYAQKDFENAINNYSMAIELDDQLPNAYFKRGIIYFTTHLNEWALNDFNKAIGINPNNVSYYFYRGCAYREKKEFELAINDFKKIMSINPVNTSNAYFYIGQTYEIQGEKPKAINSYQLCIKYLKQQQEYTSNKLFKKAQKRLLVLEAKDGK